MRRLLAAAWDRLPLWVTGVACAVRTPDIWTGNLLGHPHPVWAVLWAAAAACGIVAAFTVRGPARVATGSVVVLVLVAWPFHQAGETVLATQAVFVAWATLAAWSWVGIK